MATRITSKGRVTLPRKVREALLLSPGDGVEFVQNGGGDFVVRKAQASGLAAAARRRARLQRPRVAAQVRRRAAELLALLRGLD
jgi:antitoxin PrlF